MASKKAGNDRHPDADQFEQIHKRLQRIEEALGDIWTVLNDAPDVDDDEEESVEVKPKKKPAKRWVVITENLKSGRVMGYCGRLHRKDEDLYHWVELPEAGWEDYPVLEFDSKQEARQYLDEHDDSKNFMPDGTGWGSTQVVGFYQKKS